MDDIDIKYKSLRIKFYKTLFKLLITHNYSWSNTIITQVDKDCGFHDNYHYILFPNGIKDIIQKFEAWQDQNMLANLDEIQTPDSIRKRIALALETRIIYNNSHNIIQCNSSFLIKPNNLLLGHRIAYTTCDSIWRYAGDKSTDFNHYTKRYLLLSVYLSSQLFYISDNSNDSNDTKSFIKRSLDDIINIAKCKKYIPKINQIPFLRLLA